MLPRRLVFFAVLLLTAGALTALMAWVLAPGGWTIAKALLLLCFAGVAPWLGVCVGNAVPGVLTRVCVRWPARAVLPVNGPIDASPAASRTALAVTIRDETMASVLPPLRRLLDGLDHAGAGERFALFILSDTRDAVRAAQEAAAVAAFRAGDPCPGRIRYRRRPSNDGFKAGNVMDFLDHHATGFDLAVMLDADSEMTASAVLRLVGIMQAAPHMGIVQHLTVGRPAVAAFPRLFQFGMRAGMRIWATGQAWWQGDEGPYWGHNAILRIAPFREHCRLPRLPSGGVILSHDQIEAARLRAAGWGVCVWAEEVGSLESNPPALPEFLGRDARWLVGNLQYWHLLCLPGFRPMGRWQMLQAILLFAGAPLYTVMLALTSLIAVTGGAADVSRGRLLVLTVAWPACLYAPKLLGYAEVLLSARRRARYGGGAVFVAGAVIEFIFALLLDATSQPSKTLAMIRLALGAAPRWLPQNRADRGVRWAEATRLFWPHTLFGLAVYAGLLSSSWIAALWALPFAGGLLVAIPFCVLTADRRLSSWLHRHGIAAIPEEIADSSDDRPG